MRNAANITSRELFEIMWRYARTELTYRPENPVCRSAFALREFVESSMLQNLSWYDHNPRGVDLEKAMAVADAVLWAVHWRFFPPIRECKGAQSERRYSWNVRGDGEVDLIPPRLP